jgi:mannan endo-1,4-beta-mannosidase
MIPIRREPQPRENQRAEIMRNTPSSSFPPVTPDPSPEAVDLLQYLYAISGKRTLTGQHCAPLVGSTRLAGMHKLTGHYPAVFGQDFGFSAAGTWDGINFRQPVVDEAIRRHAEGFIITLMWHAVCPADEEPVVFEESIKRELADREWRDLFTPGSGIHERWKSQVDVIAWFLKQLREAGVPLLWRPYHEMNGEWFWWGKKTGDPGYRSLYRMLFDRLTQFHRLNNLIWVFNANEVREGAEPYDRYYPGDDVVDVLATDVYKGGFARQDYDQLRTLAGEKPIALGEVGTMPSPEILRAQPRWTWFMHWGDPMALWMEREKIRELFETETVLTWENLPWVKIARPRIHHPILK